MPTSIQDYRAFGIYTLPAPFVVAEGDPEYVLQTVNETGLPNGTYVVHMTTIWVSDKNKYFHLSSDIQGAGASAHVAKSQQGANGDVSHSMGRAVVEVTDGTLSIDMIYDVPDQGGVADITVVGVELDWERKLETAP